MRFTLATSPHVRHAAVLQSDFAPVSSVMYSFAPVGLLSLIGSLRRDRPEVETQLYDLNRRIRAGQIPLGPQFYRSIANDIAASSPDAVGFMTECDSYHHVLQIATEIKEILPACAIILGGPHASVVAEETMLRCNAVDAIVIGEGESTVCDLIDAISSGHGRAVSGAVIRFGAEIIQGGQRPLIECLDTLPLPAFDLYRPDPGEEFFLEVGRGCPFQCTFCSTAPYWRRKHRVKSAGRVVLEVERLVTLFGVHRVHFTHDLFTTNRTWVGQVCDALVDAGTPVQWTCSARTDTVDRELLSRMKRAGCCAIYFGVESGSKRILKEIRKDIPLEQSFDILRECRNAGITPNVGFIAGFPSEDEQSLIDTFSAYEKALRIGCRPAHLFAYCPFAGSSMYGTLQAICSTGHFVDIPLGDATDCMNRARISADKDLYGAYFRPILAKLVPGQDGVLDALDEFSPLVEAALVPALALADLRGSLYVVFCDWLRWIHSQNDARNVSKYRRWYGTPCQFAEFLVEALACNSAHGSTIAAARAVHANLSVTQGMALTRSTTMASHRSLLVTSVSDEENIGLETILWRGSILAVLSFDYDVTPVMNGALPIDMRECPTFLAWRMKSDQSVDLLKIDECIFHALRSLEHRPCSVAALVAECCELNAISTSARELVGPGEALDSIVNATRQGLLIPLA